MKSKMYIFFIGFILIFNDNLFCQDDDLIGRVIEEFNGQILLKQFYGPPGYGKTPKIDSIESLYVLKLNEPTTFTNWTETIVVEEIQLFFDKNVKRNFSIDKDYNIKGKAFFRFAEHHRTPIIIEVYEILEIIPK
jgi:hypothetical protein